MVDESKVNGDLGSSNVFGFRDFADDLASPGIGIGMFVVLTCNSGG